ncbi:hypothetical protein Salat_2771900, partial [Sesamum alatum]
MQNFSTPSPSRRLQDSFNNANDEQVFGTNDSSLIVFQFSFLLPLIDQFLLVLFAGGSSPEMVSKTRGEKALKWSNSTVPNVVKLLNDARDESRNCKLLVADQLEFEVQDGSVHYVVNLARRTYDCK